MCRRLVRIILVVVALFGAALMMLMIPRPWPLSMNF